MKIFGLILLVILFSSCEKKQKKERELEENTEIKLTESLSKSLTGNI